MENKKKKLIDLIEDYDEECPDCGEVFFGAVLNGSTEIGHYPVYVSLDPYPLKCGKCPRCAQKCYDNLTSYVKRNGKVPCDNNEIINDDEDINEFISNMEDYIDCLMYNDENYQSELFYSGIDIKDRGELIDLFEYIYSKCSSNK